MHDNDPSSEEDDKRQEARVRWFLQCAFSLTGVVIDRAHLNQLAKGFVNAMREENAVMMFTPIESITDDKEPA